MVKDYVFEPRGKVGERLYQCTETLDVEGIRAKHRMLRGEDALDVTSI